MKSFAARRGLTRISLAASVIMAACGDEPGPLAPTAISRDAAMPENERGLPDREYLRIARAVPGFAGLYFDADSNLTIALVDPSREQAARAAVQPVLDSWNERVPVTRVSSATFDFAQLVAWKQLFTATELRTLGAVSIDVDEVRNRVVIGVGESTPLVQDRLRQLLSLLRIPANAVAIENDRFEAVLSLRAKRRPFYAAYQLETSNFAVGFCTTGPVVSRGTRPERYVVTAAHCTGVSGRVDGTVFFQPTALVENEVGYEVEDPAPYVGGDCQAGYECRRADAALIIMNSPSLVSRGYISRGISQSPDSAPPEENHRYPYTYVVAGSSSSFVAGATFYKNGRTTGETYGALQTPCVDLLTSASSILYKCQYRVNAGTGKGDSGAPVFFAPAGSNLPHIAGIVSSKDSNGRVIFSPWFGVEAEFGPLVVTP